MTREEAIELLDNLTGMVEDNQNSDYDMALKMAIKVLEQEPCEDAVSRQVVLKEIPVLWNGNGDKDYCMETLRDFVTELPPVTPTRKHGEWERETFDLGAELPIRVGYQCSECGNDFDSEFNFCPHCGSDMKGGEE